MRTPSLRRRVTLAGVLVMGLVLLVVNVFVYLAIRDRLEGSLDELLETRLEVAVDLAADFPPDLLAARLQGQGIPAVVDPPGGDPIVADPATSRFGQTPPGDDAPLVSVPAPREHREVTLEDGTLLQVFATRAGIDATLRSVLLLEAIGTAGGLAVAVLLLQRASDRALSPLDTVVATARRTAEGRTGERLRADDSSTELGRMAVAFDDMLDALEAAVDDARAEEERSHRFLADAAHQLRTPIASVRASVESLLREQDPARRDELFGVLLRETARSSRLVASLLRIARLDRGEGPDRQPVDLAVVCADEVDRAASLSPRLDVTLELGELPAPQRCRLDEAAVRESLANLLDNARRHARSRVLLHAAEQEQHVVISVSDDGPGIPAAARTRIFERFVSLDGRGGAGLGLSIAQAVSRAHGGDLTYDGDRFVLRLPLEQAPAGV